MYLTKYYCMTCDHRPVFTGIFTLIFYDNFATKKHDANIFVKNLSVVHFQREMTLIFVLIKFGIKNTHIALFI